MNKISKFCYELVLIFTFLVLILVPVHSTFTKHVNINKTYSHSMSSFSTATSSDFKVGDVLSIYRFNPHWKTEIGKIEVLDVKGDEVLCSFNPESFVWPMGRHGRVVEVSWPLVKIDMGANFGLKTGDKLILFKDRKQVGTVRLAEVFDSYSMAKVMRVLVRNLKGLTVTEYLYATQVAFFKNKFFSFFEIFIFLFAGLMYSYFFIIRKKSLIELFGKQVQSIVKKIPRNSFGVVLNVAICGPLVWFVFNFTKIFIVHFLNLSLRKISHLLHLNIPTFLTVEWFDNNALFFYFIGVAIYFYIYFSKKASPILIFWKRVSYHPKKNRLVKGIARDVSIWCLHLVIAYAFAYSLFSFLLANLAESLKLAWPGSNLILEGSFNPLNLKTCFEYVKSVLAAVSYMLTHLPKFQSAENFFFVARYSLWSVTIVGCLFGYGHSIFGYLWGKKIRNLDFTIMGWLVNAVCYGPLLGFVIWALTPHRVALDPTVVGGALYYLMLTVELVLNLIYTLSIWNLGKMFGVMTDKGVRTTALYSVVRHPSYALEALMFVVIGINNFALSSWVAASAMYFFVYYVRSEREDNFMSNSNPEYIPYKEKVPFKFIPGLY